MRLTISRQLIIAFALVTALIFLGAVIGSLAAAKMQQRVEQVVDETFPAVIECESLKSGLNHSFAALRGFIILGADPEEAELFDAELDTAWGEVDEAMSKLTALERVWTARDRLRIEEIQSKLESLRAAQQGVKEKAHAEDNILAYQRLRHDAEPLAIKMDTLLTEIIAEEGRLEATPSRKEFLSVLSDTRGTFAVALTTMRAYVVSGDATLRQRFDDEWKEYLDAYAAAFRVLRRMNAAQKACWSDFDELHAQFSPLPVEILELRGAQDWNQSHHKLKTDAVPLAYAIREQVTALEMSGKQRAAQDQLALKSASRTLRWTLIVVAAFTIVGGGTSTFLMGRRLIAKIGEAVTTVAATAEQMSVTAQRQQQTAQQQVLAANELTTTMEELSRSAESSTQQASQVLDRTRHVLELAADGTKAVDQTVEGMSALNDQIDEVSRQIVQLSEHSSQIDDMTALVRDLAKRTNVLALNASVEAAQAGEQGVGFAVVAGEIRKLAEESSTSAKHIQQLVTQVQSSTNSTVMATEEGNKTLKSGTQLAERTTTAFHLVADSIDGAVEGIQQISLNAKEQADSINQVGTAMDEISRAAGEGEQHATNSKLAIEQLGTAVSNLQEIV